MILKAFFKIVGGATIKGIVLAKEKIGEPHGDDYK